MNMLPSVSLQIWPDPNESPTLCYFPDFVPFTNITTTINPERVLPTTQQEVKGLNQKVSRSCHPWLDILDIFPWRTAWFAICIVWLWQKRRDVELVNGERVGKESLFAAGGREGGKTRRREEKHRWRERESSGVDGNPRWSEPLHPHSLWATGKGFVTLAPYSQACQSILRSL